MKTASKFLLTKEDMTNPDIVPEWVIQEYKTFHDTVTDKTFPCYFGMTAEMRGELNMPILQRKTGLIFRKLLNLS